MNEHPFQRKVDAAERLVSQGYLRKTASGGVILTKRGKQALEQFTGGPLARDSFDLDSAYYGSVQANRRREITWAEKFLNAWSVTQAPLNEDGESGTLAEHWARVDAQADVEGPQPKPESTVYWITHFHEIDEPSLERLYLGGWEGVTCWRLDVHRAVAELAKKRSKNRLLVFALYAEGWDREQIGQLLRSMSPGEEWSPYTVNDLIKEVSRTVRRRTDTRMPKAGFRDEELAPTSLAHRTEDAIEWARGRDKPGERRRGRKPEAA